MITLKEWMILVDYKITEGSDWFGNIPKLYCLSTWNGLYDGYSSTIVFDPTDNQRVYLVEMCDYKNERAYKLVDPKMESSQQAWDDVNFVELETDEDFLQKAKSIISGEPYDTRVTMPIEFTNEELLVYMTAAHERDVTFNEFVESAIKETLKNESGN